MKNWKRTKNRKRTKRAEDKSDAEEEAAEEEEEEEEEEAVGSVNLLLSPVCISCKAVSATAAANKFFSQICFCAREARGTAPVRDTNCGTRTNNHNGWRHAERIENRANNERIKTNRCSAGPLLNHHSPTSCRFISLVCAMKDLSKNFLLASNISMNGSM